MIKSILFEYRFIIIVAIAAIFYVFLDWQKSKQQLYQLMLTAKSMAKDMVLNSGKEQEEWVLQKAYQYLPKWITLFVPKDVMRKIIRFLYAKAKDYLDDGVFNNSL